VQLEEKNPNLFMACLLFSDGVFTIVAPDDPPEAGRARIPP